MLPGATVRSTQKLQLPWRNGGTNWNRFSRPTAACVPAVCTDDCFVGSFFNAPAREGFSALVFSSSLHCCDTAGERSWRGCGQKPTGSREVQKWLANPSFQAQAFFFFSFPSRNRPPCAFVSVFISNLSIVWVCIDRNNQFTFMKYINQFLPLIDFDPGARGSRSCTHTHARALPRFTFVLLAPPKSSPSISLARCISRDRSGGAGDLVDLFSKTDAPKVPMEECMQQCCRDLVGTVGWQRLIRNGTYRMLQIVYMQTDEREKKSD